MAILKLYDFDLVALTTILNRVIAVDFDVKLTNKDEHKSINSRESTWIFTWFANSVVC